ncbi:MAG: FecR domain-containing protein, partial [Pseudomonas caspiana]
LLLQPSSSRRNLLRGLAAFGLLGGATWLGARSQPGQALLADFSTSTGERRHLQLNDGSGLDLNASSAIDLRFSSRERLLLLRHGELVVHGAADAGRPFIVRSAQGDVQALGTRFLVRQEADATRVVVLKHSVRLSLTNGAQRVLLQGQGALMRGDRIDLLTGEQSYQADWLDGRLSVLDAPLGDVIEALRPYRRGLIRVSPHIRHLRVQGVFPLDDTQRSLAALAETLPISVDQYGPWLTLLGPKNQ